MLEYVEPKMKKENGSWYIHGRNIQSFVSIYEEEYEDKHSYFLTVQHMKKGRECGLSESIGVNGSFTQRLG